MQKDEAIAKPGSDGHYHVMPIGDLIEHTEQSSCECQPELSYRGFVSQMEVWVHKRLSEESH